MMMASPVLPATCIVRSCARMKDDPRLHLAGGEADMKLRRRSEEEQGGGVDGVQE